jgi:hypothetical protein
MLNEKTLADIQLKMNNVNYLWHDNFRFDLDKFLEKLSALNQPSLDGSGSSFGSVFFKPKNSSGYGLAEQERATGEQKLDSGFATPRLG